MSFLLKRDKSKVPINSEYLKLHCIDLFMQMTLQKMDGIQLIYCYYTVLSSLGGQIEKGPWAVVCPYVI